MKKINVAIISGGWSEEREISFKSGESVLKALDPEKYNVKRYDPKYELMELINDKDMIDIAFILLHGRMGEDGSLQGLLKILRIPFVGSGVLGSAVSLNKKISKKLYTASGLLVPRDAIIRKGDIYSINQIIDTLGNKLIVKPIQEGSSIGTSICNDKGELERGIEHAFQYDSEIIIEEFIEGVEVSCPVLGLKELEALPLVEIIPRGKYTFFDYKAKYTPGATKEICPAHLPDHLTKRAQQCAITAHRSLECRVWSRTDMIVREQDIYVLETNTIPGMTETSLFPLSARVAGIPMSKLLDRLIELSLKSPEG